MVGQSLILEYIDNIKNGIPHFIVIVGSRGGGKTTLAKYIAEKLDATFSICGIKVDEIREVINTAYNVDEKVLYCIQNVDTMRNEAKNAMLKITEEPPKNAYFILTVEDDSTLLDTIKSRATVLQLEPYSIQDLTDYYTQNYDGDVKYIDIATTPYELDMMMNYGEDFINYVSLVLDNIGEVQPANAFKSSSKLALKSNEGYDLKLFFRTFTNMCIERIHEDIKYANAGIVTIPYECKSTKLGINKQQLYDQWVFEVREVLV